MRVSCVVRGRDERGVYASYALSRSCAPLALPKRALAPTLGLSLMSTTSLARYSSVALEQLKYRRECIRVTRSKRWSQLSRWSNAGRDRHFGVYESKRVVPRRLCARAVPTSNSGSAMSSLPKARCSRQVPVIERPSPIPPATTC